MGYIQKMQVDLVNLTNTVLDLENKITLLESTQHSLPKIVSFSPELIISENTFSNQIEIDTIEIQIKFQELQTEIQTLKQENGVLANYILEHIKSK